jgi:hypothetical protein
LDALCIICKSATILSRIDVVCIAVNRNEDGTYHIDTNPTHNNFAPCIVKDNIAEDVLFETFAAEMVSLAP